jgi:hypothetical protein
MKDARNRNFHHRVKADGTIDSICPRCFQTAANAENEADLHERETAHACKDKDLSLVTENLRNLAAVIDRL